MPYPPPPPSRTETSEKVQCNRTMTAAFRSTEAGWCDDMIRFVGHLSQNCGLLPVIKTRN